MKKNSTLLLLIAILLFNISYSQNNKSEKLTGFLDGVVKIDPQKLSGSEPINQLANMLTEKADKTINLTKENIVQSLEEAKNYDKILIIVGVHTLVKIKDLNDCKRSGAWGTCMPNGVGLIQKSGDFENQTDYINNLIGIPDGQIRKMFFFK
jgi:hypothetical protein